MSLCDKTLKPEPQIFFPSQIRRNPTLEYRSIFCSMAMGMKMKYESYEFLVD